MRDLSMLVGPITFIEIPALEGVRLLAERSWLIPCDTIHHYIRESDKPPGVDVRKPTYGAVAHDRSVDQLAAVQRRRRPTCRTRLRRRWPSVNSSPWPVLWRAPGKWRLTRSLVAQVTAELERRAGGQLSMGCT